MPRNVLDLVHDRLIACLAVNPACTTRECAGSNANASHLLSSFPVSTPSSVASVSFNCSCAHVTELTAAHKLQQGESTVTTDSVLCQSMSEHTVNAEEKSGELVRYMRLMS